MANLSTKVRGSAEAQVAATVKKTARMREEVASYKAIAASAKAGSAEQIAASNLASRAQGRLSASLGVSSRESDHLRGRSRDAERDLGRMSRGALAGSGIFHTLGRSIAFASGGFLAFAGAGAFIRSSIDAAREAAVTQRQLGTQIRANGGSLTEWKDRIESADLKLSHLSGFTSDQLEQSLTTIVRSTGDVGTALRINAIAADVARGRHISLTSASVALGKAFAGNATALKRLGIVIPAGLSGMDALNVVSRKFAGQARAGTTAQQRFGAELHNSQIIIGTALLPTINQLLARGSTWLSQMNRSGKLQKDVTATTHFLTSAIKGVKAVLLPTISAFRLLGHVVGGTKNEIKLLGTAFLLLKVRSSLIGLGLIRGEVAGVGAAAEASAGKVGLLRGRLLGLRGIGPIGILIAADIITSVLPQGKGKNPFAGIPVAGGAFGFGKFVGQHLPGPFGSHGGAGTPQANAAMASRSAGWWKAHPNAWVDEKTGKIVTMSKPGVFGGLSKSGVQGTIGSDANLFGRGGVNVGTAGAAGALSSDQRLQIALATNPNDLAALRTQVALAQKKIAGLRSRRAAGKLNPKDFTDAMVAAEGDLTGAQSQIDSILQDQARTAKDARDKAARAVKAARAKQIRAAKDAARKVVKQHEKTDADAVATTSLVFKGAESFIKAQDKARKDLTKKIGSFQPSQKLQLAEAQAGATVTDKDDMAVARAIRSAAQKALKSGKLAFQGQIDAWNAIASANSTLGNQAKAAMTGYRSVGANAITAGLHLSIATRKELDARISQSQAHFGHAPTGEGVLGQTVHVNGPVYVNADNPHQMAEGLRKAARHTPHQRRGHNAGARSLR